MKNYIVILVLFFLASCEDIFDVIQVKGPCTIQLVDGGTITTQDDIEILQSTGTITYRDENAKLWSVTSDKYLSYSCGN